MGGTSWGRLVLKGSSQPSGVAGAASTGKEVPGSRVTFVKARVDTGVLPYGAVVFQPSHDWLKDTGLYMEKSVLRTDPEGYVNVLVQNPFASPRWIGSGGNCVQGRGA